MHSPPALGDRIGRHRPLDLMRHEWLVSVRDTTVVVVYEPAEAKKRAHTVFLCAHGAGGHRDDASMLRTAATLRARGIDVARFNFPYREHGSARPDPMPLLQQTVAAVAERVGAELPAHRLILGGRSMGGRAASMLVAEGFACDGLLLLAYPLHPAGQPEKLRDAHLGRIDVPVLCLNGTRDPLCDRELMDTVVRRLPPTWTMHWLDGADHSFHVLKRSGTTDEAVMQEVGDTCTSWVRRLR